MIPATLLPIIAAMLAWFAYAEHGQAIEQEYRFLEAHARIAEGQMAGLLRNIEQLLTRVAEERPALAATDFAAYERQLAERMRQFPELKVLAVTDAAGRIGITVNPRLKGFDASGREYFRVHRGRASPGGMFISRPFMTPFGETNAAFSVPIYGKHGRFLGVVAAGVHPAHFAAVLTQIKPAGDSMAAVFNNHGDLLYRLPDPEKHAGASVAAGSPFQAFMRSGQRMSRSIGIATIDGVERIYVHTKIGNTTLGLAVARPLGDVLAAWRRNLALRAVAFGIAAAATLCLAGIAHGRQREIEAGKAAAEDIRRQEEQSRCLLAAQEEERRRLAIELHDRTSPNLSALRLNLESLTAALAADATSKVAALQEDMEALLTDTIASIRDVSVDVRPPLLDYAGLWPALAGYVCQLERRTGIRMHAASTGLSARLAPEIEAHVFRIAQEALTNCIKHARARTVYVSLAQSEDVVELAICDDGIGFDPDVQERDVVASAGYGLTAMRRRAQFIGGRLSIGTGREPEHGTCIRVSIPWSVSEQIAAT